MGHHFSKRLEDSKWKIEKQLLKDRQQMHQNHEVFIELKKKYLENKLSIFMLKDEEVVTWLDTSYLLRRSMQYLFERGTLQDEMKIIMEYPFVLGNQMRSDYLILFKQSIIIVEFGMFNQDEKRKEERYTKKVQENIGHRHLLANLTTAEIYTYVVMYRPEFDLDANQVLTEHLKHNNEMISKLATFLEIVIKKQLNKDAYFQLAQLEKFR
jgi:hypothetical protein